MRLTIFGASGGVGRLLVARALAGGHEVRAVYRRPAGTDDKRLERLVIPDITDDGGLREAVRDRDAVVSCVGLRRRHPRSPWSTITSPLDLTSRFAAALCAAPRDWGVRRVIALSAAGVGESAPRMSWPLRALFASSNISVAYLDLERMEQRFRDSDLDWCCVRPTTLTDGGETAVRVVDAYGLLASISRATVAAYVLRLIEGQEQPGTRTPMISS
jgi:nucleoside-diphosphate-sugar epimerase